MTKKDYELIANVIKNWSDEMDMTEAETRVLVDRFAMALGEKNILFNFTKFKEACYEGKHIRKSIKGVS